MTTDDVEIAPQRAIEKTGRAGERLISENGRQFIAKDFRNLLPLKGMKQVRTSRYYPQSNGKLERAHKTIKSEAIRKTVVLSYEDAVNNLGTYVPQYNTHRLHAALL